MFHSLDVKQALERSGSSENGLSAQEAAKRLEQYGRNRLAEPKGKSRFTMFIEQFKSVLIIILLVAAVISFAVGEVMDAVVIFAIVIMNAAIGFYLEIKAEKSIYLLKQLLSLRARVLRGGEVSDIDSEYLVPGDIVLLESGSRVPADLYIIESADIRVDQSALTGESVPVEKNVCVLPPETPLAERQNIACMGTTVTAGRGRGLVFGAGMNTEFGKIAGLAQSMETGDTRLKQKLDKLGRKLGLISLLIAFGIFLLGIFQERGVLEMFLLGVSLAVAVIPEGLPAVVTITLALGVRSMVKKNCLIRNLSATETLGEVSVICTDKTGTLTQNEMTVRKVYFDGKIYDVSGRGYDPRGGFSSDGKPVEASVLEELIRAGAMCNHAIISKKEGRWISIGDSTEGALTVLGMKADITQDMKPVREVAFTSSRKRMTSVFFDGRKFKIYAKGAPEQILPRCTEYINNGVVERLGSQDALMQVYDSLAGGGLRILALARSEAESVDISDDELESGFIFLGFACIADPPRPEVPEAVRKAHDADIDVIMVTGDSPVTAKSIGAEIGIGTSEVITGVDLDRMDDAVLTEKLKSCRIFARVTPEHKFRIVEVLQRGGHVTAMTGDGVNDAPALKKSDVGIAMGIRGTDVAKDASDMILVDDNFASIIDGVEEGRRQYENIQRVTRYLLSANFGEIVTILAAMLLKLPVILFAVQILWINLATDGMLALALGTDPSAKDSMKQPPRNPNTAILTKEVMAYLLTMGVWIGGLTVGIFAFLLYCGEPEAEARSAAFVGLIIFEMVHIFNFRDINTSVFKKSYFDNMNLNIVWAVTFAVQLLIIYLPESQELFYTMDMTISDWFDIALLSASVIFMTEVYRRVARYRL